MKYMLDLVPLDFSHANVVDIPVRAPGRVLSATLAVERSGLVVAGVNGKARSQVARAALIVEVDPDGPMVTRRFVGLLMGTIVDASHPEIGADVMQQVALVYTPDGQPLAIYDATAGLGKIVVPSLEVAPL